MKRHLVVIDDEKAIRSILGRQLSLCDFEVHGCESGKEGLKYVETLIETTPIDVILLDWMMPNMSGLDVLAKLKSHRKMRDIPVFMLTSKIKVDDLDKAYDLGADNYITKPFSVKTIGSIINFKLSKFSR
jgi:two-component system alkaline phosphatase synthesis response regulator PhoP